MTLEQLREDVLRLPVSERLTLIGYLIDSLEADNSGEQISQSLLDQIAARSDELHQGAIDGDDWRVSLGRLRSRLLRKPS